MTYVHINRPEVMERRLVRTACPTCEKRRWMAAWFMPWYGWDHTCLKCGENWCDGEMVTRPFLRGWRIKSVEAAKARWRAVTNRAAAQEAGEQAQASARSEENDNHG